MPCLRGSPAWSTGNRPRSAYPHCVPVDSRDPVIGRLIDRRYEVGDRIARGGMASVYAGVDLRLDRKVAVKVMHPHLGDDPDFRERFIQEAKAAARLAHPNVVNTYDQGEDGDLAWLVMELVPSITLRDLLAERGRITPEQSLDVLEAILAGLSAAPRAGRAVRRSSGVPARRTGAPRRAGQQWRHRHRLLRGGTVLLDPEPLPVHLP